MCQTLSQNGFEVYLVVANAKSEIKDGVHIVGVPVSYSNRVQRMWNASKAVFDKAVEIDAEIYHFHDPELLRYAVKVQKMGKHTIFDSHEDVPNDILDKAWLGPRCVRQMVSWLYSSYEKSQARKLSGVISVVPEITEKFHHPQGLTIHNYPKIDSFDVEPKSFMSPLDKQFRLVYNGGLTPVRGIRQMIKAMSYLGSEYSLCLMGPWETDEFYQECQNTPGWDKVVYMGMVDFKECVSVLKSSHLGLVTLLPVTNFLTSIPVKSFEFIASGLPMIMSDFPFWRNLFSKYAHFVDPENPEEIANAIKKIKEGYDSEKLRIEPEGRELLRKYTWENEVRRLVEFYQNILR
ncbi:MAG: glycosyltransferase [Flavobacteriales bacterium]|nr:glycosyltransferase [Flavobacteriales bacterium]